MITIVPIFIFALLDLLSTYYGVCVNHGIELNVNGINLMQEFGFIPGGLLYMLFNMMIALIFSVLLWKSRHDEISRVFVIVVIVLFLTDLSTTVVMNVNTISYQETGSGFAPPDSNYKDVTPRQKQMINETFSRNDFCRLI